MPVPDQKRRAAFLFAALLLWLAVVPLHSQPASTPNRVLELDGDGDYVELPPNIFNNLTNATVEAWVKWRKLEGYQRFFCYGDFQRDWSIGYQGGELGQNSLSLYVCANGSFGALSFAGAIQTNEWEHIAASTGSSGMRLYFNGRLVATNNLTYSFPDIGSGSPNYIGRLVSQGRNYDFDGQIDEFRVWNVARSESDIQATMYQRLNGTEPGLVGLWNFDSVENGVVKDLSPGGHDARMIGNARIISSTLGRNQRLRIPSIIAGRVLDESGQPVTSVYVRLAWQNAARSPGTVGKQPESLSQRISADGGYSFAFFPQTESCELTATSGDLGVRSDSLAVKPGDKLSIDLTLKRAVSISGRVAALDDSPLPNVVVQIVKAPSGSSSASRGTASSAEALPNRMASTPVSPTAIADGRGSGPEIIDDDLYG